MIHRLVEMSVRQRGWVLLVVVFATALGLRTASTLRFDAFPDLTNVQVQVLTSSPGMGTEEVEQLVTVPIERALGGSPGLVTLRSLSRPGISAVTAVFADDVDLWLARQVVAERVATARSGMPEAAGTPELAPPSTGLGEVYQFTVTSDRHERAELYRVFQRDVAPRLRSLQGVVDVNAWGAGAPQLDVRVDPFALAARGLRLVEVEDALRGAIGVVSGGSMPTGGEQVAVRGAANPLDPDALAEVGIGSSGVRVGDVARVERGGALPLGLATADGRGEALFVVVQLLAGADARSVVASVRARMDELRRDLPEGVRVEVVYDREKLVGSTLATVERSLVEGGILVIVVLLVLLGDLRAGLIVASVIPLSLVGALAGLRLLGMSGNLMSLGAIDFGLVVDGAVVIVEGLVALHVTTASRDGDFISRTRSLARPVLVAVAILLLVYVPILALGGAEGKLFRPMAVTVLLALVTALVLSLTYVPAASALLLRPSGDHVPRVVAWAAARYEALAVPLLARPRLASLGALAVLVASLLVATTLGVAFVPRLEEGDLVLQVERLPTVNPEEALRGNTRVERALLAFPEVLRVASRTGSPAVATDPMGMGESDILIQLAPKDTWTTSATLDGLVDALSAGVRAVDPAVALTFTQPIEMRFNELLEGIPSDVGIELYGRDLDALLALGHEVAAVVSAIPGAADVRTPSVEGIAVEEAIVDPARATRLGVEASDVLALVETVQVGRSVGSVLDGEFRDQVVLKLDRPEGVAFADLPLVLPGGLSVPLSEVADVRDATMPAAIRRQAGTRRVIVQANVRGRDLGGFVADAQRAVEALPRPEGSWIAWSGKYEQLRDAAAQTALILPVVLIGIFALLRAAFGGLRATVLVFLNVPLAVSGGVFVLAARGLPVSMSAIVGFIALFGIAVMNGVVLVSRILDLLRTHPPQLAALVGARERFRPVVMTATVAGLGFLPMALAHGVGAEVQRPLATVVIGGLLTSTALTLLVLPSLCARFLRPEDATPAPSE